MPIHFITHLKYENGMQKNKGKIAITGTFPSKKEFVERLGTLNNIEEYLFKANSPRDYLKPRKKLIVENIVFLIAAWLVNFMVFNFVPSKYHTYVIVIFVMMMLYFIIEFVYWLGKTPESYAEMMTLEFNEYTPFNKERYDALKLGIEDSGIYHLGNIKAWINEERRDIRAFIEN